MSAIKPEIAAVYAAAVKKQLAANNASGWTTANSVAVIEELADAAYSDGEGFDLIRPLVVELGNASAFMSKLRKAGKLPNAPESKPRGSVADAMALLNS